MGHGGVEDFLGSPLDARVGGQPQAHHFSLRVRKSTRSLGVAPCITLNPVVGVRHSRSKQPTKTKNPQPHKPRTPNPPRKNTKTRREVRQGEGRNPADEAEGRGAYT